MRAFTVFLAVSAGFLSAPPVLRSQPAEDFLEANADLIEEIQSFAGDPTRVPSGVEAQRIADVFSSLILRVIQHEFPREDRERVREVEVQVVEDAKNCATIDGARIFLSGDCFEDAYRMALWLSHDIMIEHFGPLELPEPVLSNPFAQSAILPVIRPLPRYSYSMDWRFLACPNFTECRIFQGIQTLATHGFILAHEISHFLLDHGAEESYSVAKEMAADSRAREILKILEEDSLSDSEDWDHGVALAFAAAPLIILEYQIERLEEELLQQSFKLGSADRLNASEVEARNIFRRQRQAALKAAIPEHLLEDVEYLVEPDREDGNTGRLIIRSARIPDLLLVDGIVIPYSEIVDRPLLVSSGRHQVLARHGSELAYAKVYVGGRVDELDLEYRPLASRLDLEAISRYERSYSWFDMLLHSSDRDFRPRDSGVALAHSKALQRMGMASLIDPDAPGLDSRDRRYVARWKRRGEALHGWGLPAARAAPEREPPKPEALVVAQDSERDQAELQAKAFLKGFGLGEYRRIYRSYLGRRFRDAVTEEAFVAQYSLVRSQVGGGGSDRRLIDERAMGMVPGPQGPIHGSFHFFRYKTRYPVGNVYEDVTLEDEGGGAWRIVGCFLFPAPD